jgi:hypothetical protein
MKIYNKIVLDIGTGAVLEEDSFEYSGPLALCGGGDAPAAEGLDDTEKALNEQQLQMLKDQSASQKELEPFILESMGYTRDENGKIVKGPATASDILLNKQLSMAGYDPAGGKLTEDQMLANMTDAEKLDYQVSKASKQRELDAINGKLAISPALEEELSSEENQAQEMLQRKLGKDWALSTSGQSLMAKIKQKGNLVREEARRGLINSSEGITSSQANRKSMNDSNIENIASGFSGNTINKLQAMMGYTGLQTSGMNDSLSMSSKLASERANRQNVAMQNYATKTNSSNGTVSTVASGVGTAAAAAAAAA